MKNVLIAIAGFCTGMIISAIVRAYREISYRCDEDVEYVDPDVDFNGCAFYDE